jgi:RimJ/RimL family protein N-acetyltransferase
VRLPERIETSRLALRPPRLADAETIFRRYAQDAEVARFLLWTPRRAVGETEAFLRDCIGWWAAGSRFVWVIETRVDPRLLGTIDVRPVGHAAEVGYALARDEWGKGYMTEALAAVVEVTLARPEIYRVWAACDVENGASARVMEKAGMAFEGRLRRFAVHPNLGDEPRDVLCYAKTR